MHRQPAALGGFLLLAVGGCNPMASDAPPPTPTEVRRPADPSPRAIPSPVASDRGKWSWETDRDRTYAEFLRDHSSGMLKDAAVAIERKGELRVELDKSVLPDDTLDLTKSLMAGARKDFPDGPIALKVYDPGGELILKARSPRGQEVHYQLADDNGGTSNARPGTGGPATTTDRTAPQPPGDMLSRGGVTPGDREFATWAEEHGRKYLRYVEADLEKHGRLYFGVTREVKPADLPDLTRSLLEGAQKKFPRRELVATVFDPEGKRIGRAHLGSNGNVRWEE
jgi:hypothetical protein